MYGIADLRTQAQAGWHQTYQAHNREIRVDLVPSVPDVDKTPVLKAVDAPFLNDAVKATILQKYASPATPETARYFIRFRNVRSVENYRIIHDSGYASGNDLIVYNDDDVLVASDAESMGTINQKLRSFRPEEVSDKDKAYADNNDMLLSEAISMYHEKLSEFYGSDYNVETGEVTLYGRLFQRDTGEPIRDKGSYNIRFKQMLRGLPLLSGTMLYFQAAPGAKSIAVDGEREPGLLENYIFTKSRDSFTVSFCLFNELELLHEDIPLAPISKVISAIEPLIEKGYIRDVYSLELGYVMYISPDDQFYAWYLVPSWVAMCKVYPNAQWDSQFNDTAYIEDGYQAVIVNAQTGEWLDWSSESAERSYCPPVVIWP